MAKTTSSPKGGKGKGKGKKGKLPLGQRIVIGAAVLGLAWYLYTKQKAKKQAEEQKRLMGGGGPLGGANQYGAGSAVGPLDPNTGLPCSEVFGGCPNGGVMPGTPTTPTFPPGQISGCMVSTANNYNPAATISDGTCDYTPTNGDVYGCTDELADNHNPLATINEVSASDSGDPCTYPSTDVYGCTDATAANYDETATINETSSTDSSDPCTYNGNGDITGCMDPLANNYLETATIEDNSCTYDPGTPACPVDMTGARINDYDCAGVYMGNDTSCCCLNDVAIPCWSACPNVQQQTFTTQGCGVVDNCGDSTAFPLSAEPVCAPIPGCTDPAATNYDASATSDDGTCQYLGSGDVWGCTDPAATNYDASANNDDGSCVYPDVSCDSCDGGYPTSNWYPGPTCPQNTIPSGSGNPCEGQNMVDCSTCDGGSPMSNSFNNSCPTGWQLTSLGDPCEGQTVTGCTNQAATNYNSNATQDDGSCVYPDVSCDSCDGGYPTSNWYPGPTCPEGTIPSGSANPCAGQTVMGCTDGDASNYNPSATQDDGSCTFNVTCYWCDSGTVTGQSFSNTSPGFTCPNGSPTGPNGNTNLGSSCGGRTTGTGTGTGMGHTRFSGFDGGNPAFGRWQRQLSTKIVIDDTDWNPLIS